MDHVVYLDAKADELGRLVRGAKSMIIRGAAGRKLPYGRVKDGDWLYFIENDGTGQVKGKAQAVSVFNSDKMNPNESAALVERHQDKLNLTAAQIKRWSGKRYLVLIEVSKLEILEPFEIDKSDYGNMDDWLPVEKIDSVRRG